MTFGLDLNASSARGSSGEGDLLLPDAQQNVAVPAAIRGGW